MNNHTFLPIPDGYLVKFQHINNKEDLEFFCEHPESPPRYITFADLYRKTDENPPNWVKVDEAEARCSRRDVPSRFLGRLISQNRVLVKHFGRNFFRGKIDNGQSQD